LCHIAFLWSQQHHQTPPTHTTTPHTQTKKIKKHLPFIAPPTVTQQHALFPYNVCSPHIGRLEGEIGWQLMTRNNVKGGKCWWTNIQRLQKKTWLADIISQLVTEILVQKSRIKFDYLLVVQLLVSIMG